jgi:hypothetical protein
MAEQQLFSHEAEVARALRQFLTWQEGQIRQWHTRMETALDAADWDFYSLAAVTHDRTQYQDAFADALSRMESRRELLASTAAGRGVAVSPQTLEAERTAWQDIVREFTQAARDSIEQQTHDLAHAPFPDEDQTTLHDAFDALQRDELREQITAIQDRLDDNTPTEDWSSPGWYYGTFDDELQTRLLGQLSRLQARLDALEQPELQQGQHREEGMSY